jgi:tRNA-2-methylthio-N6-dimethylallyladenosine synthase
VLSGRTRGNKLVHFEGPKHLIGEFVHVKVTEPKTWFIKGELAEQEAAEKPAAANL